MIQIGTCIGAYLNNLNIDSTTDVPILATHRLENKSQER